MWPRDRSPRYGVHGGALARDPPSASSRARSSRPSARAAHASLPRAWKRRVAALATVDARAGSCVRSDRASWYSASARAWGIRFAPRVRATLSRSRSASVTRPASRSTSARSRSPMDTLTGETSAIASRASAISVRAATRSPSSSNTYPRLWRAIAASDGRSVAPKSTTAPARSARASGSRPACMNATLRFMSIEALCRGSSPMSAMARSSQSMASAKAPRWTARAPSWPSMMAADPAEIPSIASA